MFHSIDYDVLLGVLDHRILLLINKSESRDNQSLSPSRGDLSRVNHLRVSQRWYTTDPDVSRLPN